MCGRFTLTWEEWRQVAGALGIDDEVDAFANYRPRFSIAPTDQHFIITSEFEGRKARRARWGLVNHWVRDNSRASQYINGRNARGARDDQPTPLNELTVTRQPKRGLGTVPTKAPHHRSDRIRVQPTTLNKSIAISREPCSI